MHRARAFIERAGDRRGRGRSWSLPVVIILSLLAATGSANQRAAAASGGVTILQSSAYEDDLGRVSIVGELRNDSGDEIALVMLAATFYDAAGAALDRAEGGIALVSQLLPGETAPFVVDTRSTAAAGYVRYEIAESHYDGGFGAVVRDLAVSIDRTSMLASGWLRVDGHVTNTSGQPVLVTWVAVALCDEAGTVRRAASGAIFETLAPDERAAFAVIYTTPIGYSDYRTWVTAHPAP